MTNNAIENTEESTDVRRIVQIKRITAIEEIADADAIEVVVVGGWRAVVKKNEFSVGEAVLYIEIDAFLPAGVPEFEFLVSKSSRTVVSPLTNEIVSGHVLRTIKLRGQISQGLILPLMFGLTEHSTQEEVDRVFTDLGVFKWEPPLPAGSAAVGKFPNEAQKTDSERVQNLTDEFLQSLDPGEWFATEKIDGTSSTFVMTEDGLKVAGRNWTVDPENSLQAKLAKRLNLAEIMPVGSVVQGEIFGEGIQGNHLKVPGTRLLIFTATSPQWTPEFSKFVADNSVPKLDLSLPRTVDEAVEQAFDLKSTINSSKQAEGIVWWHKEGKKFSEVGDRANFKSINNLFLAKQK